MEDGEADEAYDVKMALSSPTKAVMACTLHVSPNMWPCTKFWVDIEVVEER